MIPDIPIVVIGYNRPGSLSRLLDSLARADYRQPVTLYISLDGSPEASKPGNVAEVYQIAKAFEWKYGEKTIIHHEKNLGLREHVLRCGDLSAKHDALIALEDDLVVSERFYDFALQSFQFYGESPMIGGISLYHHAYNESAQFPFIPLEDGSDVYFLQYASSWGQMWTKAQWKNFRRWYDDRDPADTSLQDILPPNIRLWPKNSWKKYFILYLTLSGKYFVFPRISHTTIFGDEGTNLRIRETFLQVPLWHGKRDYHFVTFDDSAAVYDSYCEILPDRLKRFMRELSTEKFETDLYGMKPNDHISTEMVISSRKCKLPILGFGREMKPHEENLISNVHGNYFSYGNKKDFEDPPFLIRLLKCHKKEEVSFWYPFREYHFYRDSLLWTEKKPLSPFNPVFLSKKFYSMASYTVKYFSGKK